MAARVTSRYLASQPKVASWRGKIRFYECEHRGDLDHYVEDLTQSGADILRSRETGEDECMVEISVADWREFLTRFKKTNSYDFSHLAPY